MLPAESGTLPHRPWTPMSLVNGRHRKRSAAGGWSEAEVCAEELPLRGGPCMEDNAAASGSGQGLAIFSLRLLQGLGCEAKFECTLLH